MLILGIESSCDDTAAAVLKDGVSMLSNVVASQDDLHGKYGGIVPELASRRHIQTIIPVVNEALERAGVGFSDIDAVGVTKGPGLVGSILIGLNFAKASAYLRGIPFVGVNHIEAHTFGAFIDKNDEERPSFPFVSLVVSGGHTVFFRVEDFTSFKNLGQTRDDAAGEAFDKVAKLMGLGYPGGAAIDRLAKEGDRKAVCFARPYISKDSLETSFSGLKTAAVTAVRDAEKRDGGSLTAASMRNVAAGFQEAIVDVLVDKAVLAARKEGVNDVVVSGGVACNSRLRERLIEAGRAEGVRVFIPPPKLCSDNAAMIALSAHHLLKKGERGGLRMNAVPSGYD